MEKIRRAIKVLYFVLTLPVILFFIAIFSEEGWSLNYWALFFYSLVIFSIYFFISDVFLRGANYIGKGVFTGLITKKRLRKYWRIAGVLGLFLFISYFWKNKWVCSGVGAILNDNWVCSCVFWYKKGVFGCSKASEKEMFSWLNNTEIQDIKDSVEFYETEEEKLQKMEEKYKNIIWPRLFLEAYSTGFVWDYLDGVKIWMPQQIRLNKNKFDEFKIYPNKNIYIEKSDFDSFVGHCIKNPWILDPETVDEQSEFYKDQKSIKATYTRVLTEIMNGTIKSWPVDTDTSDENLSTFNPHSCGFAGHLFNIRKIKINGVNGVILDYNGTQDLSLDAVSAFFKQVVLVKNMDEIYTITFDYNIWDYAEQIVKTWLILNQLENKWEYYEGEITLYWQTDRADWWYTNNYTAYLQWKQAEVPENFVVANKIIEKMIASIELLNQ